MAGFTGKKVLAGLEQGGLLPSTDVTEGGWHVEVQNMVNAREVFISASRYQGLQGHHGDPSRYGVIQAHFDWLVTVFCPQVHGDFLEVLMLTPV